MNLFIGIFSIIAIFMTGVTGYNAGYASAVKECADETECLDPEQRVKVLRRLNKLKPNYLKYWKE